MRPVPSTFGYDEAGPTGNHAPPPLPFWGREKGRVRKDIDGGGGGAQVWRGG